MTMLDRLPTDTFYTIRTPTQMGEAFFSSLSEAKKYRQEQSKILGLKVSEIKIVECETTYYYKEIGEW
jgi:hypothetical protein